MKDVGFDLVFQDREKRIRRDESSESCRLCLVFLRSIAQMNENVFGGGKTNVRANLRHFAERQNRTLNETKNREKRERRGEEH